VTTALGAKQEGLTIVYFSNKLIVSCKEAVRFPLYLFFLGGGFLNWIVIFYSNSNDFNKLASLSELFMTEPW
jgi:hypothetical protein